MLKVRLPRGTCVSVTMSVFYRPYHVYCAVLLYSTDSVLQNPWNKVDMSTYYRVQFNSIGNSKASLSYLKLLRFFKQFLNHARWPITQNQFKLEIRVSQNLARPGGGGGR